MSSINKESANYIVATEILNQTKEFTVEDILSKVQSKLKSYANLKEFIENKINSLCELGLISGTGIFYYVLT